MKKIKALFVAGSVVVASAAQAAVPAGVTAAIETAGTDATTIGGAVLIVMVGISAFKYMRRAM